MSAEARMTSIDALRGIVLFGILLVHLSGCFSLPQPINFFSSSIDIFLHKVIYIFLPNRCNIVFAILFGVSFYFILKKPQYSSCRFIWRCVLLIFLGLLMKKIYTWDALMYYGLMGIVLVIFRGASNRTLLVFFVITFFATIFLAKYQIGTLIFHSPEIYRYQISNSLLDIINYPLIYSVVDFLRGIFNDGIFRQLSYFILGYYLAKSGTISNIDNLKIKHLLFMGFVYLLFFVLMLKINKDYLFIYLLVGRLRNLFGALFYAISFLYLYKRVGRYLSYLEAYGKLGLTNYCMQNIFGVIFIFSILTPGDCSFSFMFVFFVFFYILQLFFSVVWLRYFKYGPLEWCWRCLTHLQYIPNRKGKL